jgi:hypothetical protein
MATTAMVRLRADRLFYSIVPAVVAVTVLTGFGPSWFARPVLGTPAGFGPLTPVLVVHGTIMTAWILLAVVQPLLIGAGNRALHRTLGMAGAAIAILIVLVVPITTIHSMRSGGVPAFPSIYVFSAVNTIGLLQFAVCVAVAIANRTRAETHKRWILLSLMPLIPPAIGRTPYLSGLMPASGFLLMDMVLVAGIWFDLATRGRVHPAWRWGAALMLGGEALMVVVGFSSWWRVFADWAMRLPV